MKKFVLALLLLILPGLLSAQEILEKIEIVGNDRVTPETILYYLTVREGDYYVTDQFRRDFRVLWSTGFFSNIKFEETRGTRGRIVRITVEENPRWETATHGLEAAFNVQNLSLGLAVFFLARTLAVLYFIQNIDHPEIIQRARRQLLFDAIPFVVFFLLFTAMLLLKDGFAVDPQTGIVSMERYKYLHNFLQMPVVAGIFLTGVILVLLGILRTVVCFERCSEKGIWLSGTGTVLTVFALFLVAGFNHTAFYPSTYDLQSSLTIGNSSSSRYTLTAMSYVSLFVPVVLAYVFYTWRAINRKKTDVEELDRESHKY